MKHWLPLIVAAMAAGCAAYDGTGLRPGASTESDVRRVMGAPALELRDSDGSRHYYYPRGPLGHQTFVADVGEDGVLHEIRGVLSDATFNRIRPGLTGDDVLRMIGPPREKAHFERLGQTAWDYKFVDTWGYPSILSVMLDKGDIVVGKVTRRIERFDSGR
jgi:outer membrane protein assembly factor BamE (lipoprotein component of BamABCDE complex)